jgi:hypothetical protein
LKRRLRPRKPLKSEGCLFGVFHNPVTATLKHDKWSSDYVS